MIPKAPRWLARLARRFGPRIEATDREFLEPAREILETPPSPIRLALTLTICAVFAGVLIAATFGRVDIYAVAPGRIQPTGRSKVIQPLDGGKVSAIYVKEGSQVSAGQPVLDMDPVEVAADRGALAAQQNDLAGEVARRRSAVAAARHGLSNQHVDITFPRGLPEANRAREQAVLDADLSHLRTGIGLLVAKIGEDLERGRGLEMMIAAGRIVSATLSQRVDMRQSLAKDGWDSRANVMDAATDLQKQEAELVSEQAQLKQSSAEIFTAKKQIEDARAQFISDNSTALEQAESKYESNAQTLIKASAKVSQMTLFSPIAGNVQQLAVTTIGQVLTPGQQIMTVVPTTASLEIEALVRNQDIGFVHVGQKSVVKIDSFPFTRYGTLQGQVVRVSQDAVVSQEQLPPGDTEVKPITPQNSAAAPTPKTQDLVYPVTIILERGDMMVDGHRTKLSPGMSASVEIRTGRRRVISYLLSPFVKTMSEAGHER